MYEFHGWATIRKTPANVDEEGLYEIADEIRSHIAKLNWEITYSIYMQLMVFIIYC